MNYVLICLIESVIFVDEFWLCEDMIWCLYMLCMYTVNLIVDDVMTSCY